MSHIGFDMPKKRKSSNPSLKEAQARFHKQLEQLGEAVRNPSKQLEGFKPEYPKIPSNVLEQPKIDYSRLLDPNPSKAKSGRQKA